jgi:hypothetical protein
MMSTLPQVGTVVQLFGVGCEGCGHFRGNFSVMSVEDDDVTQLVLDPQEIHCEGVVDKHAFAPLTIAWNQELECWQARCDGHAVVVNISGHYHGAGHTVA